MAAEDNSDSPVAEFKSDLQQATPDDVIVQHAMSLLTTSAARKSCQEQEIVITCKPTLVSCDPVVTIPDCKKVSIVIK